MLEQEHVDFLLDANTHEIWAGLPIKDRCLHFSVRFPGKVIAPITMYRLNKKHGIRRKAVKITKRLPLPVSHNKMGQKEEALSNLQIADELDMPVVYLDEIVFSKKDILLRDYCPSRTHLKVKADDLFVGYRAVVAAVSSEEGFIYYELDDKAVTTESWLEYIRSLSAEMDNEPFALYMDQLQVHKTKAAKKLYNELEIFPIYNISYMPELNPIESVFSQVKRVFNRQRLWALVNDVPFDMEEQISEAFDVITPDLVHKCA
jgi:hypothetical protein